MKKNQLEGKGKKSVFLVWIGGDSVGGCWSKTRNVYQLGNTERSK